MTANTHDHIVAAYVQEIGSVYESKWQFLSFLKSFSTFYGTESFKALQLINQRMHI